MFVSTSAIRRVTSLMTSFVRGDSGQDLIEYGLLTAIIGVSGILVLAALPATMGNAYTGWSTAARNIAEPCAPQPAACP